MRDERIVGLTKREIDILRIVLGYALSNCDDINTAYEDENNVNYLKVDGRLFDFIREQEIESLLKELI